MAKVSVVALASWRASESKLTIVIGGILVFAVVIDQFFPELSGRRD